MSDRLFGVTNHHPEVRSMPPHWARTRTRTHCRMGYFESSSGNQWIAHISPSQVRITGNAMDWQTLMIQGSMVRLALLNPSEQQHWHDKFGPEEIMWLNLLMNVATQFWDNNKA
jgi:hypothetical protein